jgi:lactate dehydrogenase-like 2-hydroxyacid dehydrogenase
MKPLAIDVRDIGAYEVRKFGLEFLGKLSDMDRVIAESDVLSLHLHLNAQTRHMIDARRLGLMKPSAFLINVARGALVDEAAMQDALVAGRLGGLGRVRPGAAKPQRPHLQLTKCGHHLPHLRHNQWNFSTMGAVCGG